MKPIAATQFNKEKLLFVGAAALLSLSFYYLLTSHPAKLEAGSRVTTLPEPAAATPGKPATLLPDIDRMLSTRDRNNPFQPIPQLITIITKPVPVPRPRPGGGDVVVVIPEGPIDNTNSGKVPKPSPRASGETPKAQVDFSAVVTMNGQTYGLIKTHGRTLQIQLGDYIDEYKYTVTKIEKQAIWVTDEKGDLFVARDLTFANLASRDR